MRSQVCAAAADEIVPQLKRLIKLILRGGAFKINYNIYN
jgi:hypothetical protein